MFLSVLSVIYFSGVIVAAIAWIVICIMDTITSEPTYVKLYDYVGVLVYMWLSWIFIIIIYQVTHKK